MAHSYHLALRDNSENAWNYHKEDKHNTTQQPLIPLDALDSKTESTSQNIEPKIEYNINKLPLAVKEMREKIIKAAKSGHIENLKPLLGSPTDPTQLSIVDDATDPIQFLKKQSGDGEGLETLAILIDLLHSGYVHLDEGSEADIYVWPYFVALPIDTLTNQQLVELFQIMTAGDLEQIKEIGTYAFYRIGITPNGQWRFFITGD
ncbi:hypothetical protein [Bartonella tamiae]|uniref:Uncharacterized protein n=1 Tax=Bartonella tamiae Th239 TaxID=1094558 RepID=J1K0S0_9HYPH|nr:hypothetical protein [Bartonella tamiae]EJF90640.1 hypothetical protein ME5_01041 [Bartonella tamiae Th239]EJF93983.1 hypothetical protein MEG_00841 [Bartonella tamiae Th307]